MNLLYGEILTPILILAAVLFDWKQGNFRGIVQQCLGALCAGTLLNAIANLETHPASSSKALLLYLALTIVFYYWAYHRRRKPRQQYEGR
jgi:glycerol uptake facilitator-like aquaporin